MSISVDICWKAVLLVLPTEVKGWAPWTTNSVGPKERVVLRQQILPFVQKLLGLPCSIQAIFVVFHKIKLKLSF